MARLRLGIDVGGTFTDVCLVDERSGDLRVHKVPSTPHDSSDGILEGICQVLDRVEGTPDQVSYLAHGTTVATNALLQHNGAKVGLITTRGFRDLLELGRQMRPHLYDLQADKPPPMVTRDLRLEVDERVLADGRIERPIDPDQVRQVVLALKSRGVQAIAVCFLHAYLVPDHERIVRQIIEEEFPGAKISLSHEVLPEFREYERLSTTVANAYLEPIMGTYLTNLQTRVGAIGVPAKVFVTQSNGGVISLDMARHYPVKTALSGPSMGAAASAHLGKLSGHLDLISFDMGGTSTDVCLIKQGIPKIANQRSIGGYTIKTPMIDVHTVGAGGGSIAWIDTGGLLKVGPRSAGAEPGPACYGRGGRDATVTDANVVLQTLNPRYLLGGAMEIDAGAAHAAIERLANLLGMEPIETARGIISVVVANMVRAVRVISVQRGYDVRDFTLLACGGAGPLHAAWVARELGIPRILVPEAPGVLCAFGLLITDTRADYARTEIMAAETACVDRVNAIFRELEDKGRKWLSSEHIADDHQILRRSVDMRYAGQNYELTVPVEGGSFSRGSLQYAIRQFHAQHERAYGYCDDKEPAQLVTFREEALGLVPKAKVKSSPLEGEDPSSALQDTREVYLGEPNGGLVNCRVYDRSGLRPGNRVEGPAIIDQMDTTTLLLPRQRATVDPHGNIIIAVPNEEPRP